MKDYAHRCCGPLVMRIMLLMGVMHNRRQAFQPSAYQLLAVYSAHFYKSVLPNKQHMLRLAASEGNALENTNCKP